MNQQLLGSDTKLHQPSRKEIFNLEFCHESDIPELMTLNAENTWQLCDFYNAFRMQFGYISRSVKTDKIGGFVFVYGDHGDSTFYISNIGYDLDFIEEALYPLLNFVVNKLKHDYIRLSVDILVNEYNDALLKVLAKHGFKYIGSEQHEVLCYKFTHCKRVS